MPATSSAKSTMRNYKKYEKSRKHYQMTAIILQTPSTKAQNFVIELIIQNSCFEETQGATRKLRKTIH